MTGTARERGLRVLVISLSGDDLTRVRFGYSPLHELVTRLVLGRNSDPVVRALEAAGTPAARALLAMTRWSPRPYVPDALTPAPMAVRHPQIGGELEQLAQLEPLAFAEQMTMTHPEGLPSELQPFVRRPAAAVTALAATLDDVWAVFHRGGWPTAKGAIERDIAKRGRRMTLHGARSVLRGLGPGVEWDGECLVLNTAHELGRIELSGKTLVLAPTSGARKGPAVVVSSPAELTVYYATPVPPPCSGDGDLTALIGHTRAAVLKQVAIPSTTQGLAEALHTDPGNVSRHLQALQGAQLVEGVRYGRHVWYSRTDLGDALFAGGRSQSAARS